MATYSEIAELLSVDNESGLRQKVAVAAYLVADDIRNEIEPATNEAAQRKRYAQRVLKIRPDVSFSGRADEGYASTELEAVYRAVIIANAGATLAQIQGASDSAIKTATANAMTFLARDFDDPVA